MFEWVVVFIVIVSFYIAPALGVALEEVIVVVIVVVIVDYVAPTLDIAIVMLCFYVAWLAVEIKQAVGVDGAR